MASSYPLPEHAVYLDDKREPMVRTWEWLTTLRALQTRFAAGVINYLSLDFNLDATDPEHDGVAVVRWMIASGNYPRSWLQLHTGDFLGCSKMAALIEASGMFEQRPIPHSLGPLYRRL
jgi:hypothetical protein